MEIRTDIILKLLQFPKIGRKTAFKILDDAHFNITSDQDLFDLVKEKAYSNGLPSYSLIDFHKALSDAESILEKSEKENIKIITWYHKDYPSTLKRIGQDKAPIILNAKGDLKLLQDKKGVAIIGTRDPSDYGRKVGERLGVIFGGSGFNVISGLAMGCDTSGHKGSLQSGGVTTAVMGEGLHKVYPKENRPLAAEILDKGGLLVSEYTVGQSARPNFFVERDRIQAALSECIIVVETDIKGGTMHTVNYALEFSRILAAFDHPFPARTDKSRGNQKLIQERKATPLTTEVDIQNLIERIKNLSWANYSSENIIKEIKIKKEKPPEPPKLFNE